MNPTIVLVIAILSSLVPLVWSFALIYEDLGWGGVIIGILLLVIPILLPYMVILLLFYGLYKNWENKVLFLVYLVLALISVIVNIALFAGAAGSILNS